MTAYGSLPFEEAIAFFRDKLDLPTARWDDLLGAAHDRAFVVAGAMQADLLADLRAAVKKAIAQGTTLETFRKDFAALVEKHGWHGWTGEGTQAGEAWRTKVIYATNLRTSYAAGRYAQLQDLKAVRPYWRYNHNETVQHPRPDHLAWDGVILPADDPWWSTHFAPNGWGCRCWIDALAPRHLKRLGIEPTTLKAPTAPDDLTGIDKGWGYAPGATWHPDLDKYPYETARDLVAANMSDGLFERWLARIAARVAEELGRPEYAGRDARAVSDEIRKRLARGERYAVGVLDARAQSRLEAASLAVWLSDDTLIKQTLHHDVGELPVAGYLRLQQVIDAAQYVGQEGDTRLVFFQQDGDWAVAVIKRTRDGRENYLMSIRKGSQEEVDRKRRAGRIVPW